MDVIRDILAVLREKTCVVGIGNHMRQDDAAGLYMAEELKRACPSGLAVVNAEDILESYVFEIGETECGNILLMDAVSASGEPGSVVFGELSDFASLVRDLSTHKLSVAIAGRVWRDMGKKVYLLGIVPESIDFGTGLSDPVKKSADRLLELFITAIRCGTEECAYEH